MNVTTDFSGRTVLVTGGTKGIGFAIAARFLDCGADVVVCGRHEPPVLPDGGGRTAAFIACDVRDPAACAGLVEDTVARLGRLDILVNNAGGSPSADAATVSPRFVERVVALNLLAPFYVAQPANQVMQAQETGGSIINIGSVSATDPQPGTAAYSAAKAGLRTLTRALALEWSPKVRVNHLTVGLIRTEAAAAEYGEDGGAALSSVIPMGRMAVTGDVTNACLFLASDLAAYVTGADLQVHGGGEIPARYLVSRG
ncbi:MAG TPA: SDR family oxidoreductase [Trebonia sp.]|jgi:NAD(P)-dependent dehydrogenase (short-subunit alcohol dehydrogenase family)|nr:SDR family oxidoreductase [Trebonia sp.]